MKIVVPRIVAPALLGLLFLGLASPAAGQPNHQVENPLNAIFAAGATDNATYIGVIELSGRGDALVKIAQSLRVPEALQWIQERWWARVLILVIALVSAGGWASQGSPARWVGVILVGVGLIWLLFFSPGEPAGFSSPLPFDDSIDSRNFLQLSPEARDALREKQP